MGQRSRKAGMDIKACPLRIVLEQQSAAAERAYKQAVMQMKQTRGTQYERAWQVTENRRASLQIAHQALLDHNQEHLCGVRKSAAAGR
jgi:hypothetical protein